MLLTITTTYNPATDLGYLLHKNPARVQHFEMPFGLVHVFYPEISAARCTAALLLDVNPVGLVRKESAGGFPLAQYVNDRPYSASSFLSVAIAQVYGSALNGKCKDRPELVDQPIPVQIDARKPLIALARQYHALPIAIVLDVPEALAIARNRQRPDRDFGNHVIARQRRDLKASIRGLEREGFRYVHVLHSEEEIAGVTVTREPLWNNRTGDHGPFDIIGDVHGCYDEFVLLLDKLGYQVDAEAHQATPPPGRKALFLGDLVDRGPKIVPVLRLAMNMTAAGHALCVPGNHDIKLMRYLRCTAIRPSPNRNGATAPSISTPDAYSAGR
jgi:hypothetical protein